MHLGKTSSAKNIENLQNTDLPIKIKMGIQQIGILLLLLLFITIMINDVQRLFQ